MPRTISNSSKTISSPPIRPPQIMGPIIPPTTQQVEKSSFTQNVKDGFSLGVGVSVARNIVDRMFNSTTPQPEQVKPSCKDLIATYDKCLMERTTYECQDMWKNVKDCLK